MPSAPIADRVEVLVGRPDVHGAVGANRRRGVDPTPRLVSPLQLAVGVDRVEVVVVRADVHGAVGAHRRRGVDCTPRRVLPLERAVGVDRVEVGVPRADVHGAVGANRRRGVDPTPRLVRPLERAAGVHSVKGAVVRPEVHNAVGANRRRGVDFPPPLELPLERAVGVDRSLVRSEVHGAVGANRRRGVDLTPCRVLPLERAAGVHSVKGVPRADVHGAVGAHRRRGFVTIIPLRVQRIPRLVLPLERAVEGVDRVQVAVNPLDVCRPGKRPWKHGAVCAHRRRGASIACIVINNLVLQDHHAIVGRGDEPVGRVAQVLPSHRPGRVGVELRVGRAERRGEEKETHHTCRWADTHFVVGVRLAS
eukprot:scaffold70245_cov64-Phaeocystis_antarctica.AAC.4